MVLSKGTVYGFGNTEDIITPQMIKDVYGVDAEIVEGSKGKFIHSYDSDLDEL
jgi:iron complex transport system ATP-binding protein